VSHAAISHLRVGGVDELECRDGEPHLPPGGLLLTAWHAKATSSTLAGSRRNLATKKDLVTRDAHSQTFFPAAVGEAETAASPSPSPTFNAAGKRVGRMGAGEAIDELVPMESSE